MTKTHREWADVFVALVKKHFQKKLVGAVLYGSAAWGHETESSDIDLMLVIQDLPPGRFSRRAVLEPVEKQWDKATKGRNAPFVSTLLKTPEEARQLSPLYFDMVDRRQLLVDQNGFFKNILDDVRERLARLGATRKKRGRVEYWDLKPDYVPGEVFEI